MGTSLTTAYADQLIAKTRGGCWCVIPARKGSKRLPNKNKLLLDGKTMVRHAVEAAGNSGVFSKIVVSSDDEDILEEVYEMMPPNGELPIIPHYRPKRLARDTAQIRHVMRFLLHIYHFPETFCILIACNPFRTAEDLKRGWELLWAKDANYVMSATRCSPPPQWAQKINRKGFLEPYLGHEYLQQTQKLEPLYVHDGGFIFARSAVFMNEFNMDFHGSKCYPYFMDRSCDIDTEEQYEYAKYLMEGNNVQTAKLERGKETTD